MIRNAASVLLRRSTASASLSRATPAQIVPHLLHPQSTALSARGLHAPGNKNTMENSSSIEEKKAALLEILFNEDATADALKRNQREIDMTRLKEEKEKLKQEKDALKVARKAETDELLAMIGRQGASGVDKEALMVAAVAKLVQAGENIKDLEDTVENLWFCNFCLAVLGGGAIGYLFLS